MRRTPAVVVVVVAAVALTMAGCRRCGPLRGAAGAAGADADGVDTDLEAADDDVAIDSVGAGITVHRDVAYGTDPQQRYDVYVADDRPAVAAPIILMAHGGGWSRGDKRNRRVVENKVAAWVPRGAIFISMNYRMARTSPDPALQAADVAAALASVQQHAAGWGGDPARVVLMGHSAGAHLVALVSADPAYATAASARPWLGTVSLDSGAVDVEAIMQRRHLRLYDNAFGADPAVWRRLSPLHQLKQRTTPMAPTLVVCSTRRADSCPHGQALVTAAMATGASASVLPVDLSHGEVNSTLGLPGAYTTAVEAFFDRIGAPLTAGPGQ